MIQPRGNKTQQWFTCLGCGSRWRRTEHQAADPTPFDILPIGRHRNTQYKDIPQSYKDWAIQEYEEAKNGMHPALQRFCCWAVQQESDSQLSHVLEDHLQQSGQAEGGSWQMLDQGNLPLAASASTTPAGPLVMTMPYALTHFADSEDDMAM
eukprot:2756919-Amphidinium_carterae.1